jgi:signal transduction histidine kinase/ActR/RegA family two-component response regulator
MIDRPKKAVEPPAEGLSFSEHLRKQNERLKVLSETAGYLLRADDPGAMVRGLFERIRYELDIDAYFYFVVEKSQTVLRLASHAGIPESALGIVERVNFGQSVSGYVALHRRPIVAVHIQERTDPQLRVLKSLGFKSYACYPLLAGERLMGTLGFGSRGKDSFDEDEIEFMRTLCHYVAAAYERVTLVAGLREADRRKDEFLAVLAHELRNPLAPIAHGLEVIRRMCEEKPATLTMHRMMERQVSHLVRLVNDLLEISRITRGTVELRRERVTIRSVVENAIETSKPLIEAARHRFEVDIPIEPIVLNADPMRLAQVIANLLNNAAKYTQAGGEIRLSVRQEGHEAVISVRDSGMGIPPEMLTRIFEMFMQLDRAPRSSQDGLGIGLTLARGLVQMHGGDIEAHSDGVGRGSEFVVRLPVLVAETLCVAPRASQRQRSPVCKGSEKGCRILVVDDNVDAAESLAMLLDLLGHEVRVLSAGRQVREIAWNYVPDVIMLDLGLPDLDGFEVARQLRADSAFDDVLLVAVTGYGRDEDRFRSREAGFDRHLVKPVSLDALEALLAPVEPHRPSNGLRRQVGL